MPRGLQWRVSVCVCVCVCVCFLLYDYGDSHNESVILNSSCLDPRVLTTWLLCGVWGFVQLRWVLAWVSGAPTPLLPQVGEKVKTGGSWGPGEKKESPVACSWADHEHKTKNFFPKCPESTALGGRAVPRSYHLILEPEISENSSVFYVTHQPPAPQPPSTGPGRQ